MLLLNILTDFSFPSNYAFTIHLKSNAVIGCPHVEHVINYCSANIFPVSCDKTLLPPCFLILLLGLFKKNIFGAYVRPLSECHVF